jgi:hypothetical protein
MSAESPLKSKKVEPRKVELPSQLEVENWPIPEEPLSWEFLQALKDPEEVKKLIQERHGINFSNILNLRNVQLRKYSPEQLTTLALMRLEAVPNFEVAGWLEDALSLDPISSRDVLFAISTRYFSEQILDRIKITTKSIFSTMRLIEMAGNIHSINRIMKKSGKSLGEIFRPYVFFISDSKDGSAHKFVKLCSCLERILEGIGLSDQDLSEKEVRRLRESMRFRLTIGFYQYIKLIQK